MSLQRLHQALEARYGQVGIEKLASTIAGAPAADPKVAPKMPAIPVTPNTQPQTTPAAPATPAQPTAPTTPTDTPTTSPTLTKDHPWHKMSPEQQQKLIEWIKQLKQYPHRTPQNSPAVQPATTTTGSAALPKSASFEGLLAALQNY